MNTPCAGVNSGEPGSARARSKAALPSRVGAARQASDQSEVRRVVRIHHEAAGLASGVGHTANLYLFRIGLAHAFAYREEVEASARDHGAARDATRRGSAPGTAAATAAPLPLQRLERDRGPGAHRPGCRRPDFVRETMGQLAKELNPARFARIHRSTIVNLDRVQELRSSFNGEYVVVLRGGTRLTLSRGYREALQAQVGKPL